MGLLSVYSISLAFGGRADGELQFSDSSLQAEQILLQLRLFLLEDADLILQFLILRPLVAQVFLQFLLHARRLVLEILPHLLGF